MQTDIANPRGYQTFGFIDLDDRSDLPKSKKINVKYPHIITKGYNERIIYWDGEQFCQERI